MFRLVWVDFGDLGWIKTIRLICNGSAGFRFLLIDVGRFYAISTIWQIGLGSDRFGNILWIWFGEWLCAIVYGFELFAWIWADFNRFGWICVDLG